MTPTERNERRKMTENRRDSTNSKLLEVTIELGNETTNKCIKCPKRMQKVSHEK